MAKDRARPFSKKHRKYWLTVTGGMLLIGAIDVGIGMCTYKPGPDHVQPIQLVLPPPTPNAGTGPTHSEGMLGLGEIPVPVMQAFTKAYPQHVPRGAKKLEDGTFELFYLDEGARRVVRFRADGTTAE